MAKKTIKPSGMATNNTKELRESLDALHKSLDDAYWAASTMDSKDYISGVMRLVYDALTEVNQLEIKDRTIQFTELKKDLKTMMEQINTLKKEIQKMIKAVKTVTTVVQNIEKVAKVIADFTA